MRRFDTDIEGLAHVNEEYRTYIESGYDLRALELDDERWELAIEFQAAWDEYQDKKAKYMDFLERERNGELNRGDYMDFGGEKSDIPLGGLEYQRDLNKALTNLAYLGSRLREINSYLKSILNPQTEEVHIEEDVGCAICSAKMPDMYKRCQAEKNMRRKAYEQRKLHYQYVHDACVRREDKLTRLLKHSTEDQDKHALVFLDQLKAKKLLTGPWYYKLSMLVVLKHVRRELYPEFSMATPVNKHRMRKSGEWFWEAVFDRLRNFRTVNQKIAANNGWEWKIPTNDYSLEPMVFSYDVDDVDDEGNKRRVEVTFTGNYSVSEDAMIAMIDAKRRVSEYYKTVHQLIEEMGNNKLQTERALMRARRH